MFNAKYLVGAAALVLATSALAGGQEMPPAAPAPVDNSGFYVNVNGGPGLLTNSDPYNSLGWNAGAAFGYHFSNNIRLELAGNYFRNTLKNSNVIPGVTAGAFQMTNVMGNVYYDFDFGNSLVPYVGAGLGWSHQWANFSFNLSNPAQNFAVNISRNFLAAQGIVGIDYKITDNVRIGVNYHLVGFAGKDQTSFTTTNGNTQFRRLNNLENQFNLGLSYYF